MNNILITSYENPDLDGTACAIAYAEYLHKKGRNADAVLFGEPHREAQFVFQTFTISPPRKGEEVLKKDSPLILVDSSDTTGISRLINILNVIEVIDHRKLTEVEKFVNATAHIELVGSCATLIAEKFFNNQVEISPESAALLYSAIISNTVNFNANVTTDRDKKMAEWLLSKFTPPQNYVHDMFVHKSQFTKPLFETFMDDVAEFSFGGKTIGIFQLEIVAAEDFVKKNREAIQKSLETLREQRKFNYVFLTCIDIEEGENWFVVTDDNTKQLLERTLEVSFEDGTAKRKGIMMRKTITPLLKDLLESM